MSLEAQRLGFGFKTKFGSPDNFQFLLDILDLAETSTKLLWKLIQHLLQVLIALFIHMINAVPVYLKTRQPVSSKQLWTFFLALVMPVCYFYHTFIQERYHFTRQVFQLNIRLIYIYIYGITFFLLYIKDTDAFVSSPMTTIFRFILTVLLSFPLNPSFKRLTQNVDVSGTNINYFDFFICTRDTIFLT